MLAPCLMPTAPTRLLATLLFKRLARPGVDFIKLGLQRRAEHPNFVKHPNAGRNIRHPTSQQNQQKIRLVIKFIFLVHLFIPGIAVDQLLHVVHLSGEEWRLEDLVDFDVADAGGVAHLVAQVALVTPAVGHDGLDDLNSNLKKKYLGYGKLG